MSVRTALVLLMILAPLAAAPAPAAETPAAAPKIQVAILLDNSGSMGGLIEQAKAQLWTFINEFALAKKNGKVPQIQVALYTYGDPPPKQLLPLTDDLDAVSEKLFAVRISGGTEHCGQVIQDATHDLAWSEAPDDLKVIFIAGNEPFTQGPVNYQEACKAAIARGIIVNTIHCGSEAEGISGKWKDGALLADGLYLCINQNKPIVHIEAPQDKEIAGLGVELNKTYVPYGAAGESGLKRQAAQDASAAGLAPQVAAERAVAKAGAQYRNESWDLVDAVTSAKVKIEEVKADALPENLRKMSAEERRAYVEEQAKRRTEIQQKINDLNRAREQHVAEARKKAATQDKDTLDQALIQTLRAQAAQRHFEVPAPAPGN